MASSSSASGWGLRNRWDPRDKNSDSYARDLTNDRRAISFSLLPSHVTALDTDHKRMDSSSSSTSSTSSSTSSTSTTSISRLYRWESINEFAQALFFNRYLNGLELLKAGLSRIRAEYSLLDDLLVDLSQNPGQSRCPYELTTMALVVFMRSVDSYNNRDEYPRQASIVPFYHLDKCDDVKVVQETLRQAVEIPIQLLHHAVINIFRNNSVAAQKHPALNAIMYCFEFIYYNLRYDRDHFSNTGLRSFDEIILEMSFKDGPPLSFDEAVFRVLSFEGVRYSPDPQYFFHVGTLVRVFAECLSPREAFLLSSANDWSVCDRDAALALRAYQKGMDAAFYYKKYFNGLPVSLRKLVETVPENSLTESWSHFQSNNSVFCCMAAVMGNIPSDLLFIVMGYLNLSAMPSSSLFGFSLEEYTQPFFEMYFQSGKITWRRENPQEVKWGDPRLDCFAKDLMQVQKEMMILSTGPRRRQSRDEKSETMALEDRLCAALQGEKCPFRDNRYVSSPYQINSALLDLVEKRMESMEKKGMVGDTAYSVRYLFAGCQSPFFQYDNILERVYQRRWDFNSKYIYYQINNKLVNLYAIITSCLQEHEEYLKKYYSSTQKTLMEMLQTLREKIQAFNSEFKDFSGESSVLKQKLKRFIPEMMAIVCEYVQKIITSCFGGIGHARASFFGWSCKTSTIKEWILNSCRYTMQSIEDLVGPKFYGEFYPRQFLASNHPGVKLKGGR